MSQDVTECRRVSQSVAECRRVSQSVAECRRDRKFRMLHGSQNVVGYRSISVQQFPSVATCCQSIILATPTTLCAEPYGVSRPKAGTHLIVNT